MCQGVYFGETRFRGQLWVEGTCLAELHTPPRSRSYRPLASVIVGRWVGTFVAVFPYFDTECLKNWKEFFFSKLEMLVPSEEHPASCGCFNIAASVWGLCEQLMMAWNPFCELKSSCQLTWEINNFWVCVCEVVFVYFKTPTAFTIEGFV